MIDSVKPARFITFTAWGLVALGLLLRARQYLANRSLWLDEAMLALNIIEKNVAGLFGKLDYNQGAPLGFLLLEKLAVTLFGSGERALRLLPLMAGCASLVVFYFVARKLLNAPGLLAALALFALSPTLIYYSSEVKQYATDVFIATLLLFLFFTRHSSRLTQYSLLISGLLAPWFSHPAIFTLVAIGLTLLIENRRHPLPTLALGAAWLASFAILYLVSLRQLSGNTFLLAYWREYFEANPLAVWLGLFENPAGLTISAPLLALGALAGLASIAKHNWKIGLPLALLLIFALLASELGQYPLAGRMALFTVPLIYIFLAGAIDFAWNIFPRPRFISPLLALALTGALLYAPALDSVQKFLAPKSPEHMRPAISYLVSNLKPGDQVYIYNWALPAFRYYADPGIEYVAGGLHTDDPQALLAELDQFKGQPRVWVLVSHVYEKGAYNEKDLLLEYLNQLGQKKRQFIEPGTSVYLYLYDLR